MLGGEASHRRTSTMSFHSYEVPGVVKFAEAEGRLVVARGWGRGAGELVLSGVRVSVSRDEAFWRWMGWWPHSNVNVLDATERTLETVKRVNVVSGVPTTRARTPVHV